MKDIFTDLYKKVTSFFQAAEEKEKEDGSKKDACSRLKFVLMQDRTNLTPQLLERMRGEMIDLLSKYVEMDKEALELNFANEGESMALMLSIPVLRAKEESEIQAIIEAEDAAKAKALEETELSEEESEDAEVDEETDEEVDAEAEETEVEEVCSCGCGATEECPCGDECESEEDVIDDAPVKKSKKK